MVCLKQSCKLQDLYPNKYSEFKCNAGVKDSFIRLKLRNCLKTILSFFGDMHFLGLPF